MSDFFNAIHFPFCDTSLIEASAGTGKTYSISNLYIRLLLKHGENNTAYCRPLAVDEILVLTFTNAATFELKKRIYQRIQDTLTAFLSPQNIKDIFLQHLHQQTEDKQQAINRLRCAATLMDQASIYTINSFCLRIIQDNNFSLKNKIDCHFEINSSVFEKTIMLDMWRHLHSVEKQNYQISVINRYWDNFINFSKEFSTFLNTHQHTPLHNITVNDDTSFSSLFNQSYYLEIDDIKNKWLKQSIEINTLFSNTTIKYFNHYSGWLKKMLGFCGDPFNYPEAQSAAINLISKFSAGKLHSEKKPGADFSLAIFQQIEEFLQLTEEKIHISLKQWIVLQLRKRWLSYKVKHNLVFPNDVMQQLKQALLVDSRLLENIRCRFPVALIDEFQDTDNLQYEIFNAIYTQHKKSEHTLCLILIGDPKQAIYKFRGADLHTYINAKRTIENCYHMQHNWRSSSALVSACNTLFSLNKKSFLSEDIPFINVDAQADTLAGKNLSGIANKHDNSCLNLHFWLLCNKVQDNFSAGFAQKNLFDHCAGAIYELLNFDHLQLNGYRVKSNDICILVRQNSHARQIKQALFERGIASVYLNKSNVFQSTCAKQLLYILAAMLHPQDRSITTTALSTYFYRMRYEELQIKDTDFWSTLNTRLYFWQKHWQQHGILSLLSNWAIQESIYQNLKKMPEGLRWISDLQHIAQLLQEASKRFSDTTNTYDYLYEQVHLAANTTDQAAEELQLRLENDEALISICTVHSSKGLEYPIVFYPYACEAQKNSSSVIHLQKNQRFYQAIDFEISDPTQQQIEEDRLAEDVRLLYVALTRAKYACYVGLANIKGHQSKLLPFEKSALAHVLNLTQEKLTTTTIEQKLSELVIANNAISYSLVLSNTTTVQNLNHCNIEQQRTDLLTAPKATPIVKQSWAIDSYSQLAQHFEEDSNTSSDKRRDHDETWQNFSNFEETAITPNKFSFPKGTQIGQFIHDVLESVQFSQLQHPYISTEQQKYLKELIQKKLFFYGLHDLEHHWLQVLQNWIIDIVNQQFGNISNHFTLASLNQHQLKKELLFYFSIDNHLNTQALNALLAQYGYLDSGRNTLAFHKLHGLLTGFIDLLVEHHGQYFIIDYKSNYLGADIHSYNHAAMQQAIFAHHYDVQYILYTLALHRLLRYLPNYQYETHIGGCYYLFLRGISSVDKKLISTATIDNPQHGVFFDKPHFNLIDTLDKLFAYRE